MLTSVGSGEDRRFRHRPDREQLDDAGGHGARHAGLHVARAVHGPGGRRPHRHLFLGRAAVPVADRRAAVRRRHVGDHAQGAEHRAAGAVAAFGHRAAGVRCRGAPGDGEAAGGSVRLGHRLRSRRCGGCRQSGEVAEAESEDEATMVAAPASVRPRPRQAGRAARRLRAPSRGRAAGRKASRTFADADDCRRGCRTAVGAGRWWLVVPVADAGAGADRSRHGAGDRHDNSADTGGAAGARTHGVAHAGQPTRAGQPTCGKSTGAGHGRQQPASPAGHHPAGTVASVPAAPPAPPRRHPPHRWRLLRRLPRPRRRPRRSRSTSSLPRSARRDCGDRSPSGSAAGTVRCSPVTCATAGRFPCRGWPATASWRICARASPRSCRPARSTGG